MMTKLQESLTGRKTYLLAFFIIALEALKMLSGDAPSPELLALAGLGTTLRAGIAKG